MTEVELDDLKEAVRRPILAGDASVGRCLRDLNQTITKANQNGMTIETLTEDDMLDVEAGVITGRLAVSLPGTDDPLIEIVDKYTELLGKKGVPSACIPKRDPKRPLNFLD